MRKALIAATAALLFVHPAEAAMKGDAEAIQLANQMIENIGGKELWANARTLYVVEKSRTPSLGDGIIAEFWRDLETPREWYQLKGRGFERTFWWDQSGVWQYWNGELRIDNLPENIHELVQYYWPGEIYVLYHQIAIENPSYRYEKGDDRGEFRIINDETGVLLGTFWVNVDGDMYRWRHFDEANQVEYIYGPHKNFGDISFPAWGTMYDGSWSFDYVEVRVFETPPPVSFDPPQ